MVNHHGDARTQHVELVRFGATGVLATTRSRTADPKLYVKRVVRTQTRLSASEVASPPDEGELTIVPFGDGKRHPLEEPKGLAHRFATRAATVTPPQFLSGASKVGFVVVQEGANRHDRLFSSAFGSRLRVLVADLGAVTITHRGSGFI